MLSRSFSRSLTATRRTTANHNTCHRCRSSSSRSSRSIASKEKIGRLTTAKKNWNFPTTNKTENVLAASTIVFDRDELHSKHAVRVLASSRKRNEAWNALASNYKYDYSTQLLDETNHHQQQLLDSSQSFFKLHNNTHSILTNDLPKILSSPKRNDALLPRNNAFKSHPNTPTTDREDPKSLIVTSNEFYNTMHNVLMEANTHVELYSRIMSSIASHHHHHHLQKQQEQQSVAKDAQYKFDQYTHNEFRQKMFGSKSTTMDSPMMIHARTFSTNTTPPPPEKKDGDSSTEQPTTTPPPPTTTTTTTTTSTPQTLKKDQTFAEKTQTAITSMISSIASFLSKIPGILWFYITHPKEFKQKLIDLKDAARKEAHHYYMGSKLLIADIKTARQMVGRLLQGSTLTRRERKQFIRTVTDVFRIVPFSIFILIPFMEFALPFALRIFPNMLPSTFQDSLKNEENMKRELKSRIAMAEFFQE